jgi:hypothetical protein
MTFNLIEALDGVGETTLCAALARHLGAGDLFKVEVTYSS